MGAEADGRGSSPVSAHGSPWANFESLSVKLGLIATMEVTLSGTVLHQKVGCFLFFYSCLALFISLCCVNHQGLVTDFVLIYFFLYLFLSLSLCPPMRELQHATVGSCRADAQWPLEPGYL